MGGGGWEMTPSMEVRGPTAGIQVARTRVVAIDMVSPGWI